LTEEDLENLRPFALKVESHMSGRTFAKLPQTFPHSSLESWKSVQAYASRLSGFAPQVYDCCVNSCLAYTGIYETEDICPVCGQQRRNSSGRPRNQFIYLPVIPRLKAQQENRERATQMQYRAKEHVHEDGIIKDVMDSAHYQSLLGKHVAIGERELPHRYFDDARDIALGLSTDGFAPFKRRTKT
ncbi:uncharacterized protein TRAVEDRAFT_91364, partial [Trametes versicolor FP-101664 SS1]